MRAVVVVLLLVAATASLYSLWLFDAIREDRAEPRAAITATTPAAGKDDVRLDAWVNDSQLVEEGTLGFWIAILNTSRDAQITGVRIIDFRRPGFTLPEQQVEAGCWAEGRPTCKNTRDPSTKFKTLTLNPRDTRTIQGQLIAGSEPGRFGLSAVVEWKDALGVIRRKPISVGPVIVENRWKAGLFIAAQAAQRFLKDLALPLMLAVLAFVLNQVEENRVEARKKAAQLVADQRRDAEERAAEAQKAAAERAAEAQKEAAVRAALVQQTWTMMLPKAHANAERYYMPLAANAELVEENYPQEGELVFFFYLRFFSLMRQLIVEIGGFYLKNRDGEWLLSKVWDSIRSRGDALFTRLNREQAQGEVKPLMTVGEFQNLKSTAVDAMRQDFLVSKNYETFAIQVVLLRLFKLIIEYEMNDVYEPWYGVPEPFPEQQLKESIARLRRYVDAGEMPRGEFNVIEARLEKYATSRERA